MQLTPPCGVRTLWERLLAAGRSEPLALGRQRSIGNPIGKLLKRETPEL